MKHTKIFMISSFVLFLILAYGMRFTAMPEFSFIKETGDRSALLPVTYHLDLATLNGWVKLDVANGKATTSLKEMKSYKVAEYEAKCLDQRDATEEYIDISFYDEALVSDTWERTADNSFDECGEEQRYLTSGKMIYYLNHYGVSIATGLTLQANDSIQLIQQRCANYEMNITGSYNLSNLNEERYFHKSSYTVSADDIAYFMPIQTASMQGENHIYRIINEEDHEWITLPENRVYEELHLVNDQLLVLSHTTETFYMTVYDVSGNVLKELAYPYVSNGVTMTCFQTENYLVYSDDQNYWIYEASTYSLDHKRFGTNNMKLEDVYEQDGILYLSGSQQGQQQVLHLMVYQNKTVVYHGEMVVLDKDTTEENKKYPVDVVVWGYFER